MEMKTKNRLFGIFIATFLVLSIEGCTVKTATALTTNTFVSSTVSTSTSGKTVNNPPQVIYKYPPPAIGLEKIPTTTPISPLKVISITSPVLPGDAVTMVVKTAPNVTCEIHLLEPGFSPGDGAGGAISTKTADDNGNVSFTFTVDGHSAPGYWRIEIWAYTNPSIYLTNYTVLLTSFLVY